MRNQVKLACLACRASKTRCDGQTPCTSCAYNRRECKYLPSRRGGARRGVGRDGARKPSSAAGLPTAISGQQWASADRTATALGSNACPFAQTSITMGTLDIGDGHGRPEAVTETSRQVSISSRDVVHADQRTVVLRAYRNEEDLANAYFIYIHPYLPLLPEPAAPQYEDRPIAVVLQDVEPDPSKLPFWPVSSLSLALMAVLTLIPIWSHPNAFTDQAAHLRRSYADLLAQSAFSNIQETIETSAASAFHYQGGMCILRGRCSSLHPNVPLDLEPVLALLLLGVYEYCHWGSKLKLRARANLALTTAMDMSLHTLSPESESLDAKRRAWWATMFLVYLSSTCNMMPPVILLDDCRITTPLTEFRCCLEPWSLLVRAQDALLKTLSTTKELAREDQEGQLPISSANRIGELDSHLVALVVESDACRCVTNQQGAEASATRVMWEIARVFIHTSRIRLHCLRAFLDHPSLGEYSEHTHIDGTSDSASRRLSPSRIAQIAAIYSATQEESTIICLKSALTVSRTLHHLPPPDPSYSDAEFLAETTPQPSPRHYPCYSSLPYMVSCEMQAIFVLSLLLRKTRSALSLGDFKSLYFLLSRPQIETEKQDVERLVEELENGIALLIASLRRNRIFKAVDTMVKEAENLHKSALLGSEFAVWA